MARIAHSAEIDLRFGDLACELLDFHNRVRSRYFERKRFNCFG
jgi:hypothetical protein